MENCNQSACCCEGVFIYPNGGSSKEPANIVADNRYVMENPFVGFKVKCIAEVLYNNQWGETGFVFTSESGRRGYGVMAGQLLPDDKIVVQTGNGALLSSSRYTGSPLFYDSMVALKSLPCRIYVEKGAKLP